jgi:membrane associated rhomboid family serine protease
MHHSTTTREAAGGWWNSFELPDHELGQWAIWRGKARTVEDVGAVRAVLSRWTPFAPVLVAAPDALKFQPPSEFPQLAGVVQSFRRRSVFGFCAFAVGACLMVVMAITSNLSHAFSFAALLAFVATLALVDHVSTLRFTDGLTQRALFFYWAQTNREVKRGFLLWLLACACIGGVQWSLQRELGLEGLVHKYGVFFEPVRAGELWRLITGPFFHSGLAHYINNVGLALFVGPIVWARFGGWSLLAFFFGNLIGPLVEMHWGSPTYDSYVGMSGGVFAMCGLLVGAAALERDLLPTGMLTLTIGIACVSAFGAVLLSPKVAWLAHGAGIAIGLFCAPMFRRMVPRSG